MTIYILLQKRYNISGRDILPRGTWCNGNTSDFDSLVGGSNPPAPVRWLGETGRRDGLKIHWALSHTGSNPVASIKLRRRRK